MYDDGEREKDRNTKKGQLWKSALQQVHATNSKDKFSATPSLEIIMRSNSSHMNSVNQSWLVIIFNFCWNRALKGSPGSRICGRVLQSAAVIASHRSSRVKP
ncbi:hypothetical protein Y032_0200g1700 [Ancylostoma ceylanicum]|uniref:Uncharacterized protein n=1 Tax=Ancylostoma ceylanicum TaxID=53326 RepID=A0A016SMK4_9BILA|nr:hypothetical protein Y032_0200g1700 [Ancylostoma ceylanicum]